MLVLSQFRDANRDPVRWKMLQLQSSGEAETWRSVMLTALVYAVIYILVGYVLTYVVSAYLPIDTDIKRIINIIIWLVVGLQAIRLVLAAAGLPIF
jgi:heme/copper-type cytochrome/quinol oxidase subunit 2